MDGFLSTRQAAHLLGITEKTLLRYYKLGIVRGVRFGPHYRFSTEEISRIGDDAPPKEPPKEGNVR